MPASLWQLIERFQTGERMVEKDFDMSIFRAAEKLRRKYDIKYNPADPVPMDDAMADRLWQAGYDFFAEVGAYCIDTGRRVLFSRDEIDAALKPSDRNTGGRAGVAPDPDYVGVIAGIQTAIYSSDEMAYKIYKGCAKDKCVDGIWGGVVNSIDGKYDVVAGQPSEIYAFRRNVEIMRCAVADAGRPNMTIVNNAPSAMATIGMYDDAVALPKSRGISGAGITEMKLDFDCFQRMAYGLACGMRFGGGSSPAAIGGFSGSVEGAAIVAIAGGLQGLCIGPRGGIGAAVTHTRVKSRSAREVIWVATIGTNACKRNTALHVSGTIGDHPSAGPGTKEYFYESAAGFVPCVAFGARSFGGGTRKFVIGRTPEYGTPMESRFMGECCKSAVSMSREQAAHMVKYLLDKYEANIPLQLPGGTYYDLYNVETDEPKPEYVALYNEVKEELAGLGMQWKTWD